MKIRSLIISLIITMSMSSMACFAVDKSLLRPLSSEVPIVKDLGKPVIPQNFKPGSKLPLTTKTRHVTPVIVDLIITPDPITPVIVTPPLVITPPVNTELTTVKTEKFLPRQGVKVQPALAIKSNISFAAAAAPIKRKQNAILIGHKGPDNKIISYEIIQN